MEINTVVVAREHGIPEDTVGQTPGALPNVNVQAIPWWRAVGVRVLRVYVFTFSSLLAATGLGAEVLNVQPGAWQTIIAAAYAALYPAGMSLLANATEILTRLDVSNPGLRA